MVTLSLDTSVLVDLMRARTRTVMRAYERARESDQPLMVSSLVLHELVSGAQSAARPEAEMLKIDQIVMPLTLVDFTPNDAFVTGRLRADLRRLGRPIGDLDTLIAGQALARGWTIVTGNVRHFAQVDALPIVDWSRSGEPLTAAERAARLLE